MPNPPKLYKFRSLGDEISLLRAQEILETEKIYCSKYWELNDPMEGVYRCLKQPASFVQDLRCEKINTLIGCLSSKEALIEPLMWGHYANGFKGIAIEFSCNNPDLRKIDYRENLSQINSNDHEPIIKIFTSKFSNWKYENEWRILIQNCDARDRNAKIGKISRIYVGRVYRKTAADANCPESLKLYYRRRECLILKAQQNSIPISEAWINNGKVKTGPLSC